MGYRSQQCRSVTKDAASAAQTTGALFWNALSACLWGRWADPGNPAERCQIRGAGLYLISLYWLSLTLFLLSRTQTIWYISLEEHSYLIPELSPFELLQATIHACGWKLHEFPSMASFQVKPCRKLIIKNKKKSVGKRSSGNTELYINTWISEK